MCSYGIIYNKRSNYDRGKIAIVTLVDQSVFAEYDN